VYVNGRSTASDSAARRRERHWLITRLAQSTARSTGGGRDTSVAAVVPFALDGPAQQQRVRHDSAAASPAWRAHSTRQFANLREPFV
jgi:hypothetical protein